MTKKFSILVLLWLNPASFLSANVAQSQPVLLYQKNGAATNNLFGYLVAGVGDLDGDGKADLIIGAPNASAGALTNAGSAFVYSGATGGLLYQKDGAAADDNFGLSVSGAGDVDGDGRPDFIIGAPVASPGGRTYAGSVYVYSGASGALLIQKDGAAFDQLGWSVGGVGDVNGDGKADFAASAVSSSGGSGSVFVYSGSSGAVLFQKFGSAGDQFGWSVAGTGDVNGDDRTDFIVGARLADPGGRMNAGSAYVYSGTTGSLLFQKDGISSSDEFGKSVAGTGDVDGDGKADFIIGAPSASPGGRSGAGSAYVYSGSTGALLFQKDGTTLGDQFGWSVKGAGDVDGDGRADFVIGAPSANTGGSVFVYSGVSGDLLYQKDGSAAGDALGFSVASAGDVDGNGRVDFIVGAPWADPGGLSAAGSAFVYGFGPECSTTSFQQIDPLWKEKHYGKDISGFNCQTTGHQDNIGRWGCALTSLAMLFKYYGIELGTDSKTVNPENLNCYLSPLPNGYLKDSETGRYLILNWREGVKYAFNYGCLEYKGPKDNNKNPTQLLPLLNQELDAGRPVILRVKRRFRDGNLGDHFVLALCREGDTYRIYEPSPDPKHPAVSTLSASYENTTYGLRLFQFSPSVACAKRKRLALAIHSPVNLLVVDSSGRKTGVDKDSIFWDQIPEAGYGEENITEDSEDTLFIPSQSTGNVKTVYVNDSIAGSYKFGLTGTDSGQFLFEVSYEDTSGNQTPFSDSGLVHLGQSIGYYFKSAESVSDSSRFTVQGDFDCNRSVAPSDVVQLLNYVFLANNSPCIFAAVDGNCDGRPSPADVVTELNKVFLGTPFPCPQ